MVKSLNDVGSEDRGGTTITRLTGSYPLFVHPLYKEKIYVMKFGYRDSANLFAASAVIYDSLSWILDHNTFKLIRQ